MLGGVGLSLLLDLSLLLVNLSGDLFLDLTSGLLLFDELGGHLAALVINFLLKFFILASEVSVFPVDLIDCLLVFDFLLIELSFDAAKMVVEALLDGDSLVPFFFGDLSVTDVELLVLVVVLAGKHLIPLLDQVSLLSALKEVTNLLV